MKKINLIFLFILISSLNFTVKTFEHTLAWLNKTDKNEKITAKIFSVDQENFNTIFDNNKKIVDTSKQLKELWNICPYIIEIKNNTQSNFKIKITNWIFKQNFFRELKNNTLENIMFPHPIISGSLFLILLIAFGITFNKYLPNEEIQLTQNIFGQLMVLSLTGGTLWIIQSKINRNYNLLTNLKNLEKENIIKQKETAVIPVFVANKKREQFETDINRKKLNFENNILTI